MTVWTIRLPSFGLVLQVLREPTRADLDRSGGISLAEALLLGIALAMDAGGVGLGAGMTGLIPWAAAIAVTLADVGFLHLGISTGRLLAGRANRVAAITGLLPSVILVGMGIARLLP
jgi:putative sporulation protein YtaF